MFTLLTFWLSFLFCCLGRRFISFEVMKCVVHFQIVFFGYKCVYVCVCEFLQLSLRKCECVSPVIAVPLHPSQRLFSSLPSFLVAHISITSIFRAV